MLQQQHDGVADQVHRGLEPRAGQQHRGRGEFATREVSVADDVAEDVVAGFASQPIDVIAELFVAFLQGVHGASKRLPGHTNVQ
jgi:hypothetical protein